MNLKTQILEAAAGEDIEGVVLEPCDDGNEERLKTLGTMPNFLISWEEAAKALDYEYDDGSPMDAMYFIAWTKHRVIYRRVRDYGEDVAWLPRHPTDHALDHYKF